jgi:glycosyltransferase involved in cell wall biosynthesis
MSQCNITAVICTYNRERYLQASISSLLHQSLPKNSYEILVVDNNSVDNTRALVSRLKQNEPCLRYYLESNIGLSFARNTGWREARGSIVAYLDDDATASYEWLESILAIFDRAPSNAACVGGKIDPKWEAPRPDWLPNQLLHYLGNLDLGEELLQVIGPSWLGGGNSAYRRQALAAAGGFNTRVGRKGHSLLSMEDTCMQKQLVKMGYAVYYHPSISIFHSVPASRLRQKWFMSRSLWEGISSAYAYEYEGPYRFVGIPLGAARAFASLILMPHRLAALVTPANNPNAFFHKCVALHRVGAIWGNFRCLFSGW